MKHRRSVIEVKLRLDGVPGWGNKPEDHVKYIQHLLDKGVPHYNPEVELIRVEDEPQEADGGN